MKIDVKMIYDCIGLSIRDNIAFDNIGLVNANKGNTLTFIDHQDYVDECKQNSNISGLITTPMLAKHFRDSSKIVIECDEPRYSFFLLYNFAAKKLKVKNTSIIAESANIDRSAHISKYNVKIGRNVVVEANVIINSDVEIADDCKICAGAVLGSDGFEFKRTSRGILSVCHDGRLIICKDVSIGANSTVDKGFSWRDTIIGEMTKVDNLVYIAHGVHVGKRCFLVGKSAICGSSTIGDDVWIGPGAVVSNGISIGNGANVSIGSIVTQDVKELTKVSGNFAIDHHKFINYLKSIR